MNSNSITSPAIPNQKTAFIIAWAIGLLFYFEAYAIRSSPGVMLSELSVAFHLSALSVSTIVSTFFYTYSVTSLIAGVSLDRFGGKIPIATGIGILALGCVLFAVPIPVAGDAGRLLQGAGSAFAFTGCVYLASHGFSKRYVATAIGLTQCIGMLGGSAGQFMVGKLIHSGFPVKSFWLFTGLLCAVIGCLMFVFTPREDKSEQSPEPLLSSIIKPYQIVFTNVQSYLSGILSGLLFAPTTIFAMVWGVTFFEKDRSLSYTDAVLTCSMVPLGWVIGCPLLGWISDLISRRKPVIIFSIIVMLLSLAQLLFVPALLSPVATMLVFGIASGSAMIPYTIIKEANPDSVKGSATGAINFLTFGVTSLLAPVFAHFFGKTLDSAGNHPAHFQQAGLFFMGILLLALLLGFIVKETGHKIQVDAN